LRKTEQGRPEIFVEELFWVQVDPTRRFDLRAWMVFHEGPARPVQDVRVWVENNLVVAGGQFESNRPSALSVHLLLVLSLCPKIPDFG